MVNDLTPYPLPSVGRDLRVRATLSSLSGTQGDRVAVTLFIG